MKRKTEHLGYHHRDRRYQPREIDFSEQSGIALEGIGNGCETFREILPETYTRQIEHRLRDVIRRYSCYPAKDDDIHKHREERRDKIPPHAENRLFELDRDITFDKQPDQVAFLPHFFQS